MKISPTSAAPIKKRFMWFNFLTIPLISVLILLATKSIDGEIVRRGILGADGVEPINILALFISLVRAQRQDIFVEKKPRLMRIERPMLQSLSILRVSCGTLHFGSLIRVVRQGDDCIFTFTPFSSFAAWLSVTFVPRPSSLTWFSYEWLQDPVILSGTAFLAYFTRVAG